MAVNTDACNCFMQCREIIQQMFWALYMLKVDFFCRFINSWWNSALSLQAINGILMVAVLASTRELFLDLQLFR